IGASEVLLHAAWLRYSHVMLQAAICDPAMHLFVIKWFCIDKCCYFSKLISLTMRAVNTTISKITACSVLFGIKKEEYDGIHQINGSVTCPP
ncbi:MAG: hypothetical protein PHC90_08975, partial [Syntrophorhabdaceae bacterium]|nr:hypothetical protein [Syntrophorhabdaceae bacterium]